MSGNETDSVAADQLIAYVRRIESLEDESKAINDDKSEVYKEARGNGFDTKIIRKVVAKRRVGAAEREEQDALFQLYWDAIHGVVRAHVENIEEFDAETGEVKESTGVSQKRAQTATGLGAGGDHLDPSSRPTATAKTDVPSYQSEASGGGQSQDNSGVRVAPVDTIPEPAPLHAGVAAVSGGSVNPPVASAAVTEPVTIPTAVSLPAEVAVAGDDRGAVLPSAATVVAFRTHNPNTHFLNSTGLPRLHGCLKAELPRLHGCLKADACGGTHRALCYSCLRNADTASHQGGAA